MWSKLNPVPKFIIIFAAIGAIAYGVSKSDVLTSKIDSAVKSAGMPVPAPQSAPSAAPVAVQGFDSYDRISRLREIRIGVQGNAAPFYAAGRGFNVDYLALLTRQPEFSGFRVVVRDETNTYDEVPGTLFKNDGGEPLVDLAIDGLTLQDGDVPGVTYTIPYVQGFGYSLITDRTSNIRDVNGVGNARLGVLKGDPDALSYAQRMFPNAQIVELSDALIGGQRIWIKEAFAAGKVDALIYDYPFAVAEIANTSLQFAVSKLPESDISYKMGVRVQDGVLVQKLNAAIARVSETEDYRALLRTYFTSRQLVTRRAGSGERTYVVKSGDTLSIIARSLLGDAGRFRELEVRNNLPNPNLIQVGQVLVIPQ